MWDVEPGGGGGAVGNERADVPALVPALPRGGGGGTVGRPRRQALAQAGAGERTGAGPGALCGDVRRFHGAALSREAGGAARQQVRVRGHPTGLAADGSGAAGAAAGCAPAQAAETAAGGDDAAPGRVEASLDSGAGRLVRPGDHPRRRDIRDLRGVSRRRGGHGLDV